MENEDRILELDEEDDRLSLILDEPSLKQKEDVVEEKEK